MESRVEQYQKIRSLLDFPYAQKPSPDQIINQMLMAEQTLNLRLVNTGQPWNIISCTLETEAGTSEYEISQPVESYQRPGKAYFVIRSTDDEYLPSLPVDFDDLSQLDYGKMPLLGTVNPAHFVPEKITFYRTGMNNQAIKAVIQPVPQQVLEYTIYFLAGGIDRSTLTMNGTGPLPELTDYVNLKAALGSLGYAMWRDDDNYNLTRQKTLGALFEKQITELEPIVERFVRNVNQPQSFEMDYWNA